MKGIRVVVAPLIDDTPLGAFVPSGTVELQMFGEGVKSVNPPEPKPATLHFLVGFMDLARDAPPEVSRFARIEGELDVSRPRRPMFVFGEGAEFEFVAPEPAEGELAREVELLFEKGSFSGAPEPGSKAARLRLPEAPEGKRFAEIGAELEIEGSLESAQENNDRLDLLLREFAEITLLDEEKVPMSGAVYKIMMGDFEVASGVLDDAGFARVEGLPRGECSVVFPELGDASVRVLPREEVPPELLDT